MKTKTETVRDTTSEAPQWLDIVRQSVEGVRFGRVEIVIHEGRVIQVDTTRRTRLSQEQSAPR